MKALTTLLLFICLSVTAQVPTAKEARKLSIESRVKDSLLTVQMNWIHINSAIRSAIEEGKDSVAVWQMSGDISKYLLDKGYTIKMCDKLFKYWYIYW